MDSLVSRPSKRSKKQHNGAHGGGGNAQNNPKISVLMSDLHRSVNEFSTREALREALCRGVNVDAVASPDPSIVTGSTTGSMAEVDGFRDWVIECTDPLTQMEQTIDHEVERLLALKSYMIIDQAMLDARDTKFDQLTNMAARVFDNRFAASITLVDLGRLYFLSYNPAISRVIPRKVAFCSHTLLAQDDMLIVPDATKDMRFKDNPFVTGFCKMRFYAAAPLVSSEGYRLGAFSLVDLKPHPEGLSKVEKEVLRDFAKLAMNEIENHRTIRRQRIQLESASRALASAAHDLLTPVTGIQLSTSLLADDEEFQQKLKDNEKETMRTASHCVDTVVGICESLRISERSRHPDLRHYDKTVSLLADAESPGYSNTAVTVFDIHKTVERLHRVMNAVPKNIPLHIVLDPALPSAIMGNEVTVFRAALNLLNVSYQRTESGFIRLSVRAHDVDGSNPTLVFECEDTGPTISPEYQKRLTNRSSTQKDTEPGAFPTLSICSAKDDPSSFSHLMNHLDSLGGTFAVSSGDQDGANDDSSRPVTCMSFSIPLVLPKVDKREIVEPDHSLQMSSISATPTSLGRTKTVLVVDDSAVIRKVLDKALSHLGYETTLAVNGMEGLQFMKDFTYDFVLLDFLMPVMDGLDAVRELRTWEKENRPGFRQYIVGISAHASGKDADNGIRLGMNTYRSKPLKLQDLRDLQDSEDIVAAGKVLDDLAQEHADVVSHSESETDHHQGACLIATDVLTQLAVAGTMKQHGWETGLASSKTQLLDKLRSRNWDAVFLDGDLPDLSAAASLQEFREWESYNRIHRQRNLFLLSAGFESGLQSSNPLSLVELPPGIDGVIGKPAKSKELEAVLKTAKKVPAFKAEDIVIR